MSDYYYIVVAVEDNSDEFFQYFKGGDEWVEWKEKIEIPEIKLRYKDFEFYSDYSYSDRNMVDIKIENRAITEEIYEDDNKWNEFIKECNKEKEQIISLINAEIIDKINEELKKDFHTIAPESTFVYNKYDHYFYVLYDPRYPNITGGKGRQLVVSYLDDIDFEDF